MRVIAANTDVRIVHIKDIPCPCRYLKDPNYQAKYSSMDGSDKRTVVAFQGWANKEHNEKLVVDGIYGPLTKAAYKKWGAEFDKIAPALIAASGKPTEAPAPEKKPDSVSNPATEDKAQKKSLVEKFKALPVGAKIGIGVGAFVIFGAIVWAVLPKKKG